MASALNLLREGGEVDAGWDRQKLSSVLRCCATLEETVAGAQLVQEAIIETREAKQALYDRLETLMDADAILASNTSQLDIFPLVPAALQKRTVIAHWYTPPYLCDLVDVVPGAGTDPAILQKVADIMTAMGKEPVVFKTFVAGYVANRIQAAVAQPGCDEQQLYAAGAAREVRDAGEAARGGTHRRDGGEGVLRLGRQEPGGAFPRA